MAEAGTRDRLFHAVGGGDAGVWQKSFALSTTEPAGYCRSREISLRLGNLLIEQGKNNIMAVSRCGLQGQLREPRGDKVAEGGGKIIKDKEAHAHKARKEWM